MVRNRTMKRPNKNRMGVSPIIVLDNLHDNLEFRINARREVRRYDTEGAFIDGPFYYSEDGLREFMYQLLEAGYILR